MLIKDFLGVKGINVVELGHDEIERIQNVANKYRVDKISLDPKYTVPELFTKENIEKVVSDLCESSFIHGEIMNETRKMHHLPDGVIYLNRYMFASIDIFNKWQSAYEELIRHKLGE